MCAGDGELIIAVVEQAAPQLAGIDLEIVPAQALLDDDFPHAGGAERRNVVRVAQETAGLAGKLIGLARCPDQDMGIQQELHRAVPNRRPISFSPIRSKSSGTFSRPAMKPSRRTWPAEGASSATTLTNGLPAFAIIKDSSLAAWATSFDKLVLASWMLTDFMRGSDSGLSHISLVRHEFNGHTA